MLKRYLARVSVFLDMLHRRLSEGAAAEGVKPTSLERQA
jgi:hypothetical protein